MKEKILEAVRVYLDIAYKDRDIPKKVVTWINQIENTEDDDLFNLAFFESIDTGVYGLRLGNPLYPHMKLIIKIDGKDLLFDVDTHDSMERIPPSLPGYDRFKRVIEFNMRLKEDIMSSLYEKKNANTFADNRVTVVFLDDEDYILNIFKDLSLCLGVNALVFKSGKELLNKIEHSEISPSICFADVMMPEISGYDFVERLIKKGLKTFPVVFTTGVNPARLNKNLCDDYLLKPVSLKELEEKLKKFNLL